MVVEVVSAPAARPAIGTGPRRRLAALRELARERAWRPRRRSPRSAARPGRAPAAPRRRPPRRAARTPAGRRTRAPPAAAARRSLTSVSTLTSEPSTISSPTASSGSTTANTSGAATIVNPKPVADWSAAPAATAAAATSGIRARGRPRRAAVRMLATSQWADGLGLLHRARVPGAARLDARLRARGDLADRDRLRGARPGRLHARDRAAPGAGARARPVGRPPAARAGRPGLRPGQARPDARDPRLEPVRAGRVRQPGARLGQLGGARAGRHRGPEGAVAAPAAGRRPALGVLDDRARHRGQRPDAAADARGARTATRG